MLVAHRPETHTLAIATLQFHAVNNNILLPLLLLLLLLLLLRCGHHPVVLTESDAFVSSVRDHGSTGRTEGGIRRRRRGAGGRENSGLHFTAAVTAIPAVGRWWLVSVWGHGLPGGKRRCEGGRVPGRQGWGLALGMAEAGAASAAVSALALAIWKRRRRWSAMLLLLLLRLLVVVVVTGEVAG